MTPSSGLAKSVAGQTRQFAAAIPVAIRDAF